MALPPASLPPVSARETLPLERLVLDAGTQVRAAIKPRVVELYARALAHGDRFPRVVVFRVDGRDVLSDGFHRVYACRRARRSTIEADVRNGTLDDALWFALGATRANGARVHPGDKRCALEIAYRAWPGVQAVRLAAHVGCGASYANTVRAEVVGGRPDSSVVSGSHPSPRSVSTVPGVSTAVDPPSAPTPGSLDHPDRPVTVSASSSRPLVKRLSETVAAASASSVDPSSASAAVLLSGPGSRPRRPRPAHLPEFVPGVLHSRRSGGSGSDRILRGFSTVAGKVVAQSASIDYADLERARLAGWVAELAAARRHLGGVLLGLRRELHASGRSGAHARVLVGVDVAAVLEFLGLTAGEPGRSGKVACHGVLCAVHAAHGGVFLTRVLRVLRDAYSAATDCFRLRPVKAVALVLDTFPAIDDDALVAALASEPDGLRSLVRRAAHQRAMLRVPYIQCFAAAIVDVYNAAVTLERRLPKWFALDKAGRLRSASRLRFP